MTTSDLMDVIAVVGDREITRARLVERMAVLRAGPLARSLPPHDPGGGTFGRLVTRQLVTEEILALEAAAAGLDVPGSAGGDRSIDADRVLPWLIARVTADVRVPRRAVREYYERNADRYRRDEARHVRHILVADQRSARRLATRLRHGAPLPSLARRFSLDAASRDAGGDLGEVDRGVLAGAFEEAIFAAPMGTIIGPIESEHGWHVARVESVRPAGRVRFADVRASIELELLAAERERAFGDWLERRRSALAVIAPEFSDPGDPGSGIPAHRH